MKQHTHIVLIDLDEQSCETTTAILQEISDTILHVENHNLNKGYHLVEEFHPGIIILNLYPSQDIIFNFAYKLTKNFPGSALFVTAKSSDSEVVIQAMRAGAREFLCKPLNPDELKNAVRGVISAQKQSLSDYDNQGKVISFFGSKGGVGTTTMATNAACSLLQHTKKDILLLDLNLQRGNVALMLDIKRPFSIRDMVGHLDNIDLPVLKKMLCTNNTGISVLSAPNRIEEAEVVTVEHFEQILMLLKKIYDYIIIDTGPVLDDITLRALDDSEFVILVCLLDVSSVYNAKRCLELFRKLNYPGNKVMLTVNRYSSLDDLDFHSMEDLFGCPVTWRIPNCDPKQMTASVNKGIPVTQMLPNCKLSQSIMKMIMNFNGFISPEDAGDLEEPKVPFFNKLFKMKN